MEFKQEMGTWNDVLIDKVFALQEKGLAFNPQITLKEKDKYDDLYL